MATAADIMNYLSCNVSEFKVLTHPPLSSITDLVRAKGLMTDEVAEIRVLKADNRYVMTVVPGGSEVSCQALCDALHANEVTAVSDGDLERLFPSCDVGTAAPFGNLFGIPVVADSSFERAGRMVFAACSRTISLMMEWHDYRRLVKPIVAPIIAVEYSSFVQGA